MMLQMMLEHKNVIKFYTSHRDDYRTGRLLYYPYSNETLGWLQTLAADTKAIQQIDFTGNLD